MNDILEAFEEIAVNKINTSFDTHASRPVVIGSTELWARDLQIAPRATEDVQTVISQYAKDTGRTIVGYHNEHTHHVMLLRWPDLRPDYMTPTIEECCLSSEELARLLDGVVAEDTPITDGTVHCMMGRKVGGYDDGRIAPMDEVADYCPPHSAQAVYMVSARTLADGSVESYGEPAAVLQFNEADEAIVHQLGDKLEQYHYVIERGSSHQTDFYETRWAAE